MVGLGLFFSLLSPATADIYRYIDSHGVMHFTNAPTSSKYVLLILEADLNYPYVADSSAYDRLIRMAAGKFGVSFSLIKAVIRAESGFNPRAVSRKGARGLMQIMPGNFTHLSISDPFDPVQSIMGGVQYLKQLLDRYDQKLPLALAAYNAGPRAVDRYGGIPPYEETQSYVKKVMVLYHRYREG